MAKSQRASTRKRNNAALRSKVFGPAMDARTERLSAKLQELAAKPKPEDERAMAVDEQEVTKEEDSNATEANEEEMDVDARGAKMKPVKKAGSAKKTNRVSKNRVTKSRKPRNNVIFPELQARKRKQQERKAQGKR
ncbi:uncharacterized protein HMPREF1541_05140 [Cyphellophora europaea CBS 101466]|uniref:DUF2423 domain-containing protein n=1 Tax=Cyphellophora europaea (strain CBS 101466) TaxID=1220924 RepID=W2RX14_CYPE1|nr:uncharacterized protein HMPREF1541_05140 [Cyphellophora europaea CBS 101466]ETN40860.1 hypothetical protein HMPREF1541_05140 [Cyphellophora europaea CBS 101466]